MLTFLSHTNVGWVEQSETQHLRAFVGLRYRLTQPTNLLKVK
jgi:hypothetical protein